MTREHWYLRLYQVLVLCWIMAMVISPLKSKGCHEVHVPIPAVTIDFPTWQPVECVMEHSAAGWCRVCRGIDTVAMSCDWDR